MFRQKIIGSFIIWLLAVSSSLPAISQISQSEKQEIDRLINKMTIEEKVKLIHGSSSFTNGKIDRLNIPQLVMSDGPHGVRMEHGDDWVVDKKVDDEVTYLPTGITLASTWNPDLGYEFGRVLGREARSRGKDVILGPAINVIRTPLNGRNFEYMSEDPYLISSMTVQYIKGVQAQDVAACPKHYVANNQETNRHTISVEMSERALREIYLPGFRSAVKTGDALAVMGAYNKFRNQYCSHNAYLNNILKQEYGFDGVLISDWGAVYDTKEALMNGTDIEMGTDLKMKGKPDYSEFFMGDTVVTLVKNNRVPESVVNRKVRRVLRVLYSIDKMGRDSRFDGARNTDEHQQTALKIAEEGIVLLKNNDLLPFDKAVLDTLLVVGTNADREFARRGGSSQVPAKYEITPLEGLKNLLGDRVHVNYFKGYRLNKQNGTTEHRVNRAFKLAKHADAVIYVGGWVHSYGKPFDVDRAFDNEGVDKSSLQLPFGQNRLIKSLLRANKNTVIVLMGGGPADMTGWIDRAPAIVQAWYPGMEGGTALARILFGKVNPSGRLPMTFPKKLEDVPAHSIGGYPGNHGVVHYFEGIFTGYRYYTTFDVKPQFPFGHGLSYTRFEYNNLSVETADSSALVSFYVHNTGARAGKEVAQVYVGDPRSTVRRPLMELKGFRKIKLRKGASRQIKIRLPARAFTYYDSMKQKWVFEPGYFRIYVGHSSGDIRLKQRISLE